VVDLFTEFLGWHRVTQ